MRYPIMIEPGDENTAWSVVVPDLPGCYSAGDTLVEAKAAAEEAVAAWIEAALETGNVVPSPSKAQSVLGKCDHKHWLFSHVTVDLTPP